MYDTIKRKRTIIIVIIIIMIAFVLSRNLIITGTITGEQKTIKIGLLKPNDTSYSIRSDQIISGLNMSLLSSPFDRFRLETMIRNNTDLNSSINDFINAGTKAIFVVKTDNVLKISETVNENKILLFFLSGALSFHELGKYTFSLRDFFLIPTIILADAVNDLNIKRVGVVYIKSPLGEVKDDSTGIFNVTFTKMSGNVLFKTTYYVENKSNATEILNLINLTDPEAIVFLGHGTVYEELTDLLSEIRNYNNTIKIFSLGVSTMYDISSGVVSDVLEGVVTIEDDHTIKKPFYYIRPIIYNTEIDTYVSVEILKNLLNTCGEDTNCMQEKLHENTFDTTLGDAGFTKNGIMIRPYFLYELRQGQKYYLKVYSFNDIEKIVNDYGLNFL